jgi:acetyl-CoA carboxylase biotin carboxyl carrier protein
VHPTELPPRSAGNGAAPASHAAARSARDDDTTRALRDEVVELARALPGDLRRLILRSGSREIEVEWAAGAVPADHGAPPAGAPPAGAPPAGAPPAGTSTAAGPAPVPEETEGTTAIRAPLVGTFYASPSPGADPFVQVGDEVEAGQTVAIVEAMKLMNPIVCDEPGVVAEVLVRDAESVEYDQPLVLLRAAERPR